MASELDNLRGELQRVDSEVLELVKRRQELVRKIGEVKLASSKSTRDYEQERVVISRARDRARQLDLDGDLAEELMLLLIRESLTLQERAHVVARGEGSGRTALVIGGAGKMGLWISRFLDSQGYAVTIADPAPCTEDIDRVDDYRTIDLDHDVIVVAAPLETSNAILEDIAANPPAGVIFDIGSLKSPLRGGLFALAKSGAKVTSVHPMFGPDTRLLSGRHIIFVDLGSPEATRLARQIFEPTMAVQVEMGLDDHDRLIAYVLGLSHALNIAFFTALAESGEAAPKLAKLSSTTFDAQLKLAGSVALESPELYFEIQSLNDYGTESLSALLYAVERIRSVVRAGDSSAFRRLMEQGRAYLADRPSGAEAPP